MSAYARLLRVPNVFVLLAATTLGRLPFAINGLAVLLFVREVSGSFATAGLVTGALGLGTAIGAPLAARLVDRRGAGTLLALAIAHAIALLAIWFLGASGAPGAALAALAVLAGSAFPPAGSVLRSRWPDLIGDPDLVRTAYALDSVMIEVSFVTGPLITGLIVAVAGPEPAIGLSAALVIAGTLIFLNRMRRTALPERRVEPGHPLLGALGEPAIRIVALSTLPIGFAIGSIEVALPAFSAEQGSQALAGILLAIWSAASGVGGLVFGALRLPGEPVRIFLAIAALFPVSLLPLLAAGSPAAMAALAILAGLPIAPLIASRNELVGAVAPPGAGAESFTWLVTALLSGLAAGAAAAGALADAGGWQTAVIAAAAVAGLGALLSLAGRGPLRRRLAIASA